MESEWWQEKRAERDGQIWTSKNTLERQIPPIRQAEGGGGGEDSGITKRGVMG